MNIRYRVELSEEERQELAALLSGGKHPARKLKRAQILLATTRAPATRRSRAPCESADRRFIESSDASSKAIWNAL
jgi:hypothetical protein